MKISESKHNLFKHLDAVEKALPGKTTMPLLHHILLQFKKGQLLFMANNLEIAIRSMYKSEMEEEGSLLLPSRFIDIVKSLPQGDLDIDIDMENYQIDIRSKQSHFKLTGMEAEEYPAFSEGDPSSKALVFQGHFLKRLIRKSIFAVSHDESRPAFTGVLFQLKTVNLTS